MTFTKSMGEGGSKMHLDETQRQALDALIRNLKVRARLGNDRATQKPREALNVHLSNTFGVLGPRGAGKSTIISTLYAACCTEGDGAGSLVKDKALRRMVRDLDGLIVLRPFDCSLISRSYPPGAATLLHLERELKSGDLPGLAPSAETLNGLGGLVERYSKGTDKFETLAMELATSAGEYTRTLTEVARERFTLRKQLCEWLAKALRDLGRSAFVVLLDDFDLVHGQATRNWFESLLDELFQDQLLVVLTADFYRLEHLIWNPGAEVDDMTGRHLLNKLLPVQNRVDLEKWSLESRRRFKLFGELSLDAVVARFHLGNPIQDTLLKGLLPGWPRGLLDLFSRLTAEKAEQEFAEGEAARCRRLLSALASCRGEPLLARELMLRPLDSWSGGLDLDSEPISVEEWNGAVDVACERGKGDNQDEPKPIAILKPVDRVPRGGAGEADSSMRDALRHDALREQPLKDAEERDAPLWIELLLSFGLSSNLQVEEATRNRALFVAQWLPVASRLSQARFKARLSRQAQRSFFEDYEVPASALFWLRWGGDLDAEVSIGWEPLLSALRGERSVWQVEAMGELLVNPRRLAGSLPRAGDARSLELVPDQVWAIILLTDGLDRCPWKAFSLPLGWDLRTYIVLATLFVRTAYVYALDRVGGLPKKLSGSQKALLTSLQKQDPLELLKQTDEQILEMAREIARDGLDAELKKRTDPISKAAHSFLESLPYRALGALVEDR